MNILISSALAFLHKSIDISNEDSIPETTASSSSSSSFLNVVTLLLISKQLSKAIGPRITKHHDSLVKKYFVSTSSSSTSPSEKNVKKNSSSSSNIKFLQQQEFLFRSFLASPLCANQPHFTYLELFAGVGGFGLACEKLGGRCVFASEIIPDAQKCWQRNFGIGNLKFQNESKQKLFGAQWNKLECLKFGEEEGTGKLDVHEALKVGDIRQVSDQTILESCTKHPEYCFSANNNNNNQSRTLVDVLCAGFPCQPFSRAGNQPATQVDDGNLYLQIIRILKLTRPKVILLENVPGLHTAEEGEALKKIGQSLLEAGYDVITGIVDSSVIVPQVRRRMYFVGFRRETGKEIIAENQIRHSESAPTRRERGGEEANEKNNDTALLSNSSFSALSRFSWPKIFKLKRTFSEILQRSIANDSPPSCCSSSYIEDQEKTTQLVSKNFLVAEARWQKHLEICPDISRWLLHLDRPGPILVRSYRRGPGVGAGKKFLDSVLARQQQHKNKTKDTKNQNDDDDDAGGDDGNNNRQQCENGTDGEGEYRNSSGWHNLIEVAATISSQKDDDESNSKKIPVRWISAREGARMQGFPESFWIPEENEGHGPGIALFGNAVTVPVIAAVLHSALSAARIPICVNREFGNNNNNNNNTLSTMLKEMLLDAVPEHSKPALEKQIEAKMGKEEDVVMFSRIL